MQHMEKQAYTVNQFCLAHGISRASLYNLWKEGFGPARMRIGRRVLVSREAAETWRRKVEDAYARYEAGR